MIAPDMATMLAFITTDAMIDKPLMDNALKKLSTILLMPLQ